MTELLQTNQIPRTRCAVQLVPKPMLDVLFGLVTGRMCPSMLRIAQDGRKWSKRRSRSAIGPFPQTPKCPGEAYRASRSHRPPKQSPQGSRCMVSGRTGHDCNHGHLIFRHHEPVVHPVGPGFVAPSERINVAGIGARGMGGGDLATLSRLGANIVAQCDVDDERAAGRAPPRPFTDFALRPAGSCGSR